MFRKYRKKIVLAVTALTVTALAAIPVGAEGTADASVTAAFTGLKDDLGATMAQVAAVAVVIMGTFLAWKYGRKLFGQVAK